MKKLFLLYTVSLLTSNISAQFIHKIKADSVLITNDSCTAELNLENSTKHVNGFLFNKGNGRTEFRKIVKLNDSSLVIGFDTIVIKGSGGNTLYTGNGTLSGNRTVTMGGNYLNFSGGKFGVDIVPTANFHLKAGTATANTAPLKFTSGSLLSTPEVGSMEFLTDKAYLTLSTGISRKEIALLDASIPSGRVPYSTTDGRLTSASQILWDNTNKIFSSAQIRINQTTDTVSALTVRTYSEPVEPTIKLTEGFMPYSEINKIDLYKKIAIGKSAGIGNIYEGGISIGDQAAMNSPFIPIAIGAGAGKNHAYDSYAIAIGGGALGGGGSGCTGGLNMAIGQGSLASLTSGSYNLSIGPETGFNATSASRNILLGHRSGFNLTSSNDNISIGYLTLYSLGTNTNGGNVAIGREAGYSNTGEKNIFLGFGAGRSETGSNKLYIANSTTSSPLIYGEFNNALLKINGKLGIGTSPTALLSLPAGTSASNTAPLKFTTGTNLTTPEDGAIEFDGTNYFATSGSTRFTLSKTLTATATLNFPSTVTQTESDLTITVTGAADGDAVSLGVPNGAALAGATYTSWVSAANTVTVRFSVYGSSTLDPASGTFRVSVLKY